MDNIDLGSIGSTGSAPHVDPVQRKAPKETPPTPPKEDKVEISPEGAYVASLIDDVKKMSPTRPAVVEDMRAKVRGGNYPPPELVDGLVNLMGNIKVEVKKSEA